MSDHVLKIMKGDGFQHRKQRVRKANLLAPEKITFCCANLKLFSFEHSGPAGTVITLLNGRLENGFPLPT
jgi:hypothetical protein